MQAAAVTGLAAEATIARRAGMRAVAAGGHPARTVAAITELIAAGATGLVSFGICGGLDPALASGRLLLPDAVRDESGERLAVDGAWRAAAAAAMRTAGLALGSGEMLGAAAAIATPERKRALFAATGAVAVDLESHLVARAAAAARLPFIVLRAVADPAGRSLPAAALAGLDASGRPAIARILRALARDPSQLGALLRLARDTGRALGALRRAAPALAAGTSGTSAPAT